MSILLFILGWCCLTGTRANVYVDRGIASYYGDEFHGRKTASGELYNKWDYTCAHRKLPFGVKLKVTNLENRKSVMVRVNDRGPFVKGRIIDLSYAAARKIDMIQDGTVMVKVEIVE